MDFEPNRKVESGMNKLDPPSLAVIIPTCNRPRAVRRLVEELKPKLADEDYIFLVNDGDPGSVDQLNDVQVKTIEHCKDYYALASARNKGLRHAKRDSYEWALCLDDDITLQSNIVAYHKACATAVDEKTLLAGKIVTHDSKPEDARQKWIRKSGEDIDLDTDGIVKWGGSNLSFHVETVLEHGGFNEDFDGHWGYEDNEFYWRMTTKHGFDIEYLPEVVVLNQQLPRAGDHYERYDTTNREKLPREAFYKEPEG